MLNPINDNDNLHIIPTKDSPKYKDLLRQEDRFSPPIKTAFSNKAQKLNVLEGSPLIKALKDEFNEVFKVANDREDLFLNKLEHIFTNNGL